MDSVDSDRVRSSGTKERTSERTDERTNERTRWRCDELVEIMMREREREIGE
jgi:hypothetical protein